MIDGLRVRNNGIFLEPLMDKDVFSAMSRGVTILENLQCKYWCSAGTCLGLVREVKGWISHDTDIDVEVLVKGKEPFWITREFLNLGYKPIREIVYKGKVMQLAFMDKDSIIFDIYFYYEKSSDNEYFVNFNDMGKLLMPKRLVQETEVVKGYKCPKPVNEYLVLRFGEDWRIPKSSKSGWGSDAGELLKKM